jgi:hypothetical protein
VIRGWLLLVVGLGAVAPGAAVARELWSRGDASLEVTGSVRNLARFTKGTDAEDFVQQGAPCFLDAATFPDCPAFGLVGDKDVGVDLTRLRTRFDLTMSPKLSARLTYDHELRFGTLDTLEAELGQALASDTFLDLQWQVEGLGFGSDEQHRRWRHLLYRAFLRYESDQLDVVVGRQRIAWGVGRLWNPIDRLNAIPPLAIEPDQSPGIDAVDVRWILSGFTYLEAVWAGGATSDEQAWATRLHGVARNVDYSLMFGRFSGALTAGLDLAANLGEAGVALEAVYADPSRDVWPVRGSRHELEPFWQVVASIEHNFDVGSGLNVLLEHFYNGNALGFGEGEAGTLLPFFESASTPPLPAPTVRPASPDIFGGSRVVTLAPQNTGVSVGYEFAPLLRGDLIVLYDWKGESAVFFPTLRWSPLASVEVSLGGQLTVGKRLSQYGDLEPLAYVMAEWFY